MPNTPMMLQAGGSIYPSRFVIFNDEHEAVQGTANAKVVGITQEGTNYPPLNSAQVTVAGYAAVDGQSFRMYGDGDICLLEAGDEITAGNFLKADSTGRGVPIATTGTTLQRYGAIAIEDAAAAGELTKVQVIVGSERPAIV